MSFQGEEGGGGEQSPSWCWSDYGDHLHLLGQYPVLPACLPLLQSRSEVWTMSHHSVCTFLPLLATLNIKYSCRSQKQVTQCNQIKSKQNARSGANSEHKRVKNVARVSFPSLLNVSNFVDLTEEWELMKRLLYHIYYSQAITYVSTTADEYKSFKQKE